MKILKVVSILAFALASGLAFAAAPGKIAVSSVSGELTLVAADGSQKKLTAGAVFGQNTRVATDSKSSAKIVLSNGTIVSLKPDTEIEIMQFEQNNPAAVDGQDYASFSREPEATSGSLTVVRLEQGTATFKVAKLLASSSMTVKTRIGNVKVKGTTFSVADNGSSVSVAVVEGAVVSAPTGRSAVTVSGGKAVVIPVTAEGTAGNPVYTGVSAVQKEEILQAVDLTAPAAVTAAEASKVDSTSDATVDVSDIGVDPEVPSYADGSADGSPARPNESETNSPSSI